MVVCHCKAVFEREVRACVRGGADSRAAIARVCGAGTDCGGCRPVLDQIIAEETSDQLGQDCSCFPSSEAHAALG